MAEVSSTRIGCNYDPRYLRFKRERAMYEPPLEKSRRIRPWIEDIIGAICGVIIMMGLVMLAVVWR